jgi:16S rRNA (guanine966-N2)-methyltransferase
MRITGGTYRSRQIEAPKGRETRPTASVVREAVMNSLGPRLQDAMVLDLFCGSGILSLEAVSRGAQGAVLVDVNREAAAVARRNVQALGLEGVCRVYQSDYSRALSLLKRDGRRFNLGFFDPPYQSGYYQKALDLSFDGVFEKDALCICEYATKDGFPYMGEAWEVADTRRYGSRSIAYIRSK